MTERQFQTCLQDGALYHGIHVTPIPDGGQSARFSAPRVYDLVLTWDGIGHHIELKKVSGKKGTWPISGLQSHQEAGLLSAARCGAMAWVGVFWQVQLGKKAQKTKRWAGQESHEGCYFVQIHQVIEQRDEQFQTGLTLDWFVDNGVFVPEIFEHGVTTPEGRPLRLWDPRPITDPAHRFGGL